MKRGVLDLIAIRSVSAQSSAETIDSFEWFGKAVSGGRLLPIY